MITVRIQKATRPSSRVRWAVVVDDRLLRLFVYKADAEESEREIRKHGVSYFNSAYFMDMTSFLEQGGSLAATEAKR